MIDLIFNILNLLVFLFLIVYAFYKYGLPSLKLSFNTYKQHLTNLKKQKNTLIDAQYAVTHKIIEQEKLCIILKSKIALWKQSTEHAALLRKASYEIFKNQLHEKLAQQSKNYQYDQLKKSIMPELVETLAENLEHHFKKTENRELYFSNIFKELNKE